MYIYGFILFSNEFIQCSNFITHLVIAQIWIELHGHVLALQSFYHGI